MKRLKYLAIATIAGICFLSAPQKSAAQVSFGVQFGPEPGCPYGYYNYAPYSCAPYGYYGPEWFSNGVFVGAGPWFHGGEHFRGHIDNHYDLRHGYRGHLPDRDEHAEWERHHGTVEHFRGHEWQEEHGRGDHGDRHDDHLDRDDHH
jgi:hypothetical protein